MAQQWARFHSRQKNVSKFDPEEEIQSLPGTTESEWVKFQKKRAVLEPSPCSYTTIAQGILPQNSFSIFYTTAQDPWRRQSRSLPGFPCNGLARMLHIFLEWTRQTQHEMYVLLHYSSFTNLSINWWEWSHIIFIFLERREEDQIPRLRSDSWSWGHTSAAAKRDYNHTDFCLCWRQACRKEKMMRCVLNEYLVRRKGLLAAYAGIPKAALNNPAEPWTALWLKQYRVQHCLPAWIFTWIYGFCLLWVCAISPRSSLGTCVQTAVRPFLWRYSLHI